MKLVDLTEFYSQRGGGVRSHLSVKGHVSCQRGHSHWVIAPGPEMTQENAIELGPTAVGRSSILHVGGPSLPYDPTYHLLWRVGRVRSLVRRIRPDVLEIHSPYVAAAAGLSLERGRDFGIRTFVWHADFIDTYLRGGLERGLGRLLQPLGVASASGKVVDGVVEPLWAWVRTIAGGCDATFAASRFQTEKLVAHGVPRVEHIGFGVETDVFTPERRDLALRAALLAGKPGPLVLAIGRFAVEKRWDVVLDAYARLAARRPGARLVLLGDGPERAAMEARTRGRDDVTFAGFEKDRVKLASMLASGDVLLHGCPFETFGLGVAEAIAAGLPAVLPDQGGAAEQAHGPSVVLYPSGDAEALAHAADALLARPPDALREDARVTATAVPSVEAHFRALFDRYEALLAERGHRC